MKFYNFRVTFTKNKQNNDTTEFIYDRKQIPQETNIEEYIKQLEKDYPFKKIRNTTAKNQPSKQPKSTISKTNNNNTKNNIPQTKQANAKTKPPTPAHTVVETNPQAQSTGMITNNFCLHN